MSREMTVLCVKAWYGHFFDPIIFYTYFLDYLFEVLYNYYCIVALALFVDFVKV